jgi:endonuclease G, mitochondrial
MQEKSVFQSQLEDTEVVRSLRKSGAMEAAFQEAAQILPASMTESVEVDHLGPALESLQAGETDILNPSVAEAIIMLTGYPSLLIRDGDYDEPKEKVWRDRLNPNRKLIKNVIASVARVELKNHPRGIPWVGTCWLVDDDVFITNRHVAQAFSQLRQNRYQIMKGVEVRADFGEEITGKQGLEIAIASLIYVEPVGSEVDLALMGFTKGALRNFNMQPLALNTRLSKVDFLGVVGYPARDVRNNPLDALNRYFEDKFEVKRFAPGKVMNGEFSAEVFTHNCTTLGGNSGSVVFDIASGAAIGLHFGGNAQVQNFAVKAEKIADRLKKNQVQVRKPEAEPLAQVEAGVDVEARLRPEDFDDRAGYQTNFLGAGDLTVPLPALGPHQAIKVAKTSSGDMEIKYQHYSAVMNKARHLAFYSAVNIDGKDLSNPIRPKRFLPDPRLSKDLQTGEVMYKNNDFDRGHLTRRLDPCWGSDDEVDQGNRDSMFFPNIAPQHKDLNQKIWAQLEDHVLSKVDERDVRVSVFTGCVFSEDDPEHKPSGTKVPMAFFKVIASLNRPSGGRNRSSGGPKLQAQAFVISQQDLVKPEDLEIVFGRGFETFQVTVEHLERMTGIDFHVLKSADTFGMTPEAREAVREAESLEATIDRMRNDHIKPLGSLDDIVM